MTLEDIKRRQNWAATRCDNFEAMTRQRVAQIQGKAFRGKGNLVWTIPFDWLQKRRRAWDDLQNIRLAIRLRLL